MPVAQGGAAFLGLCGTRKASSANSARQTAPTPQTRHPPTCPPLQHTLSFDQFSPQALCVCVACGWCVFTGDSAKRRASLQRLAGPRPIELHRLLWRHLNWALGSSHISQASFPLRFGSVVWTLGGPPKKRTPLGVIAKPIQTTNSEGT